MSLIKHQAGPRKGVNNNTVFATASMVSMGKLSKVSLKFHWKCVFFTGEVLVN